MKRIFNSTKNFFNKSNILKKVVQVDGMYAGIPEYVSSYILLEGEKAIVVDPSCNSSVPIILEELDNLGISPENVEAVIITHVHLDHAGGSSLLLDKCKNANIIAHPKACKYLEDPTGIIAGATAVYGEEAFKELYGTINPIDKDRIKTFEDGETMKFGETTLKFIYTLGHATHHWVIFDEKSNGIFTGDSFGMNYHHSDKYMLPSTSPIDFDPNEMHKSIDKIMETGADHAYLTHFGVLEDMEKGAELNHYSTERVYSIAKKIPEKIEELGSIDAAEKWAEDEMYLFFEELFDLPREEIEKDIRFNCDAKLNAQGASVYVQRRQKKGLEI